MTNNIEWEDPPPKRGLKLLNPEVLDALKKRPGQWAKLGIYTYPSGAYQAIRNIRNNRSDLDDGLEFRAVSRGQTSTAYARYVKPTKPVRKPSAEKVGGAK